MRAVLKTQKFVIFLICAMGLPHVPVIAAQPANFHLIYLAAFETGYRSAETQVLVEPLFFTDGKKFIFSYDYCRQVMEKKFNSKYQQDYKGPHLLRLSEIDEGDREISFSYCDNKSFSLSGADFYSLNNRGESIRLEKIDFEFSGDGSHDRFIVPPTLPKAGRTKALDFPKNKQGLTEKSSVSSGFFFLAKNKEILQRVLPVWSAADREASTFSHQAMAYADQYKGIYRAWVRDYPGCASNSWCDLQKSEKFKDASIRLTQSLIGDFDGDGIPDVAAGFQADAGQESGGLVWLATGVFHGDGRRAMVSGFGSSSGSDLPELENYLYRPLGVFQFEACRYLLLMESPQASLRMFSVSGANSKCLNAHSVREIEDAENEYPPR